MYLDPVEDGISAIIDIPGGFPLGSTKQTSVYVSTANETLHPNNHHCMGNTKLSLACEDIVFIIMSLSHSYFILYVLCEIYSTIVSGDVQWPIFL